MKLPQDFRTYFKSLSNTELLSILENPEDYQPAAIEAASAELGERRLSTEQLEEAKQPLKFQQEKIARRKTQEAALRETIRAKGDSIFETLNPIQSGIPTTEKIVRFIVLVMGGFYLFGLVKNYKENLATLKDLPGEGLHGIIFFIISLFLPVSLYFFWKKKNIGWHLLAIYCSFTAVMIVWTYIEFSSFSSSSDDFLGNVFPKPNLIKYLLEFLLYAGILFAIAKPNLRELYHVGWNKMWATIIITTILTICLMLTI